MNSPLFSAIFLLLLQVRLFGSISVFSVLLSDFTAGCNDAKFNYAYGNKQNGIESFVEKDWDR